MEFEIQLEFLAREFDYLELLADKTTCLRKGVGVTAINFVKGYRPARVAEAFNGPEISRNRCTNEVGNCGCLHSEPKVVLEMAKIKLNLAAGIRILVSKYSPCTNCANLIVHSKIFHACVYRIPTKTDMRGIDILMAGLRATVSLQEIESFLKHEVDEQLSGVENLHDLIGR